MRNRILKAVAECAVKRPWWSLLVILALTVITAGMAGQLEQSVSTTDIMPQDDPMIKEWNTIMEEFNGASSLYVMAEGDEDAVMAFAEEVVPEIKKLDHWVKEVLYKMPRDFVSEHALMLMKSEDLENSRTLFENPNLGGFLADLNDSFEREYIQSEEKISNLEQEQGAVQFLDGVQTWAQLFNGVLDGRVEGAGAAAADAVLFGSGYFRSWDRRVLIIHVLNTFSELEVEPVVDCTNEIEKIVEAAAEKHGIRAGLTGAIVLGRDKMHAIEQDSWTISIVALIGILILFVVAFRMLVSPILAILTLVVGITWAMGLAWLLVGELNMMTSMMGVILIGLGIDFSIHIISVFTEMRAKGESILDSMIDTLRKSGAGIITGAFTTATAFLTLLVSETRGMRDFGLTLGVGILMTMLAAITVMPVLLVIRERLFGRLRKSEGKPPRDISYRFLGRLAEWLARHWVFSVAAILIAVVFLAYRSSLITMDYNMMNLMPKGLKAIDLQNQLIEVFDMNPDGAMITARTLEQAREITEAAKDMPTVGVVQSIVDMLPTDAEQKRRRDLVMEIRGLMEKAEIATSLSADDLAGLKEEIVRLEANVMEIQSMAVLGGQDNVYLKAGLLVGILPGEGDPSLQKLNRKLAGLMADTSRGILSQLRERLDASGEEIAGPVNEFHRDFARAFKPAVLKMANPESIVLEGIPPEVRTQFVGKSGDRFLVFIYPKENVWERTFQERFIRDMTALDPRATGMPLVHNSLMKGMAADGKLAVQLALVVIILILLIDFRSIRKAALAVVPLVFGTVFMVGGMELLGFQLTMSSIMAIPLIIGIGIDDGVHIIHRYGVEGNGTHRTVFSSTGRAIFLTSVTTMMGFGSLYFATFRSLSYLGSALFIGVGTCFIATVLVIPVLAGMARGRK